MKNLDYYIKQKPNYVKTVVCCLISKDMVLLGERKKVSMGLGQSIIAGIGGKVESGETNKEALLREVKEEIGVTIKTCKKMGVVRFIFPFKPKWNQDNTIYISSEWADDPIETEVMKPQWYPINKLPESRMWDDNLYWMPQVLKGNKVDYTFLYGKKGKVIEFESICNKEN
jgi:mutator protein MutT